MKIAEIYMKKYEIKLKSGYNPKTQAQVSLFAAQLDDQSKVVRHFRHSIADTAWVKSPLIIVVV